MQLRPYRGSSVPSEHGKHGSRMGQVLSRAWMAIQMPWQWVGGRVGSLERDQMAGTSSAVG